jgi:hypothetical protein
MVTYYQGRTVLVTHDVFETRWPIQLSFRIEDLYDVHVTRGGGRSRQTARSFAVPGFLVFVLIAGWPLLHGAPALRAILLVAATFALFIAFYRRGRPLWELRATYLGDPVELFSSTDVQTFGQVKRALIRALEANVP